MEFAPTHKPGHLVSGLELLEADDAFGVVAVFVHAVLLGGDVWEHAAGGVTVPVRTCPFAIAYAAHTARTGDWQAGRCMCLGSHIGSGRWRGRMQRDAFFNMLRSCCIVAIRILRRQFTTANWTLVLFRDLTPGPRVQLLYWWWLWQSTHKLPRQHVHASHSSQSLRCTLLVRLLVVSGVWQRRWPEILGA